MVVVVGAAEVDVVGGSAFCASFETWFSSA